MQKYYLYIVLTRTPTLISKLIQLFMKDGYTHAAIAFDHHLDQMYSFSRRTPHNPFIGEFRRENINQGVYGFCKTLPGAILEVEVTQEQYKKSREILNHFITHKDQYKYNYRGLLHSLLDRPSQREDRFLCSEFVYYLLKEIGVADLKIPRNLVRPQNLLSVEGKIIYQGDLKVLKPQNALDAYGMEVRNRRFGQVV